MEKKALVYTKEEALAYAIAALENGCFVRTNHLWDMMVKSCFDNQDVLAVFENGQIRKNPEWNDEHQNWTYKVEGQSVDEDELSIVFSVDEDGFIYLITGM